MWILGVDPGLGETGLCLLRPDGVAVEARTLKARPASSGSDLQRITDLVAGVVEAVEDMSQANEIQWDDDVLLAIETPVLGRGHQNVTNYAKQVKTAFLIETQLSRYVSYVLELTPTEVKKYGAGDGAADKAAVIAASPFSGSGHTVETMADAWAAARAGYKLRKRKKLIPVHTEYPVDDYAQEVLGDGEEPDGD